jgi:hypothetical protein
MVGLHWRPDWLRFGRTRKDVLLLLLFLNNRFWCRLPSWLK